MSEAFHLVSVPSSSRKGTLKSNLGLVEAFLCVSVSRYHCVLHRKLPFHPIYLHITWKIETLRGQTHPTQLSEVSVPNLFFLWGSHGEMGQCQLSAQLPKQQKPARDLHQNFDVWWVGEENDSCMLSAHTGTANIPSKGGHPVCHSIWYS